ncbi:MAG: GNAT family N-acetyltransferase [Candidatus Baltobacteraceae bacterium]
MNTFELAGATVRLEPLTAAHLPHLIGEAADPALWEFTFQTNPFVSEASAAAWLDAARTPDVRAFAIVDRATAAVAGSTRFFDIDAANRKCEIGWTFLLRRFWRSHVNSETKLLLLQYGFETWGASRIQFKAEAINRRSHAALLRIGATHEGTMRSFRIRPGGDVRDVNLYSIIAAEWPALKARLLSFAEQNPDSRAAG